MTRFFKAFFLLLFSTTLLLGCSCSSPSSSRLKVGIDPYWYPLDFGAQTPFVNGFVEELLLDMAHYTGAEFEIIEGNWSSLLDGMREKKYDCVISSMSPLNFNLAKYDFSLSFLELGPALIVPVDSSTTHLDQMKGELVGCVSGATTLLQLQKYPDVILRTYDSVSALLDAVVDGEIEGAFLDRIIAVPYIRDLYANKLMIAESSMNDVGLRFVSLKGRNEIAIKNFNKNIQTFKKQKKLQTLLQKWQLI